ncbi:MAG: hypothetical protein AAFO89_08600 [Planctomycetota bacterium]
MATRQTSVLGLGIAAMTVGQASAQPDMLITVDNVKADEWTISAELLTTPTFLPLVQLWADASFSLTGDGSFITINDYNPSYDTTLGNAAVTNGPVASFVGNTNSFFGVPDSSNPLLILDFTYAGDFDSLELQLIGQNSALFESFSGDLLLYQDAQGNPGNLTWDVQYIPAPGTIAIASLALAATHRRRK